MKRLTQISMLAAAAVLFTTSASLVATTNTSLSSIIQPHKNEAFQKFIAQIKKEALTRGISQKTVDKYLTNISAPRTKVLHALHNQPQVKLTFEQYSQSFLSPQKVEKGRKLYSEHKVLLSQIAKTYHVPANLLVAIWGEESDYGQSPAKYQIIHSLVTLAYQKHRSNYFRNELFAALTMLNQQKIPEQAFSYSDGGMGQASFMPTSYFAYAVDYNNDGFSNIWTSLPDVFASIANFLHKNHWKNNRPLLVEVSIPKNASKTVLDYTHKLTLKKWEQHGITPLKNTPQFNKKYRDAEARLIVPDAGAPKGYLVFDNFKVLLRWNRAVYEGLCIGLLADKITEAPAEKTDAPNT